MCRTLSAQVTDHHEAIFVIGACGLRGRSQDECGQIPTLL